MASRSGSRGRRSLSRQSLGPGPLRRLAVGRRSGCRILQRAYASNQLRALQQFFKWLAAEKVTSHPDQAVILSLLGRSPGHEGFLRARHVSHVRLWSGTRTQKRHREEKSHWSACGASHEPRRRHRRASYNYGGYARGVLALPELAALTRTWSDAVESGPGLAGREVAGGRRDRSLLRRPWPGAFPSVEAVSSPLAWRRGRLRPGVVPRAAFALVSGVRLG